MLFKKKKVEQKIQIITDRGPSSVISNRILDFETDRFYDEGFVIKRMTNLRESYQEGDSLIILWEREL